MKTTANTEFDFDSFRNDIINNEKFDTFKTKYGFKTRKEIDLQIYELIKLDKKFYDYNHEPVVRGLPVYESKDGFVKISDKKVNEFKSSLGLNKLEFADIKLDGNQIIIEVKAA
jgi:hypothetical protein